MVFTGYVVSRIRAINTPLSAYTFKENIIENNDDKINKVKVASYNIAHSRGGKYGAKNWRHNTEFEDLFAGNHDAFFCELKLPSGLVGIFGVHLEYRSETIRVQNAEIIAKMSSEIELPIIVLGDFNSTPSGWPKSALSENGKNAMSLLFDEQGFISYLKEKNNYTFPSAQPPRLIDWIIGKRIRTFSNSNIIKSNLSDHLMIVTEIEFKNHK